MCICGFVYVDVLVVASVCVCGHIFDYIVLANVCILWM